MLLSTSDLTFHRRFYFPRTKQGKYLYFQTQICSSKQLDCVNSLLVDTEDCLEQCEGTITDVVTLSDLKNEDGLRPLLQDYEIFKFPDLVNLKYPRAGPSDFNFNLRSRLKYVLISFSTSTFDRIKKVKVTIKLILSVISNRM